ncbi:uncharacterized protein LOC120218036 [Hibiscus syriacus]|uniref:uncharacterized protein LOC120218036 n=1 Tax=Hibiscus syriacus TaxID=106335 RepID=UPI001922CF22|nr:uncharacterized protein LOC120218036 [Hibiscus syriacus]
MDDNNSPKKNTQSSPLLSEGNQELCLHSFNEKTAPLSGFLQREKKECSFGVNAIEAVNKRIIKGKALDSQTAMDSEKKPPLIDLEVGRFFIAKDLDFPVRLPLKIEVVDDTALIGSFPLAITGNGSVKYEKKKKKKKKGKLEVDEKKAKRSRRKGRVARKVLGEAVRSMDSTKIMYSRKELQHLRFANIEEQYTLWKDIYGGLAIDVIKEYEDLATCKPQKNIAKFGLVAGRETRIGDNIFLH